MKALIRKPDVGYIDNWLHVPKAHIDVESVKNALSLRFIDSYSENKIRFVYLFKETATHLAVPRALWPVSSQPFRVVDCRPTEYTEVGFISRIKLDHRIVDGKLVPTGDDVQQKSIEALMSADSGVLQLGCGFGKSPTALEFIARMNGPGLIIVDNTNLLEQWRLTINQFLDVPGGIGRIQGDVFDWKKGIVLATYHTLGAIARDLPEEVRSWFKVIVYEEGHHLSATTFAPCAEVFYGYRLALTATPVRDDGLNVIYDNHVGPIIYKNITQKIKPRVVFKWTGLELKATDPVYDSSGAVHISKVSSFFGIWLDRMKIILSDVEEALKHGRKVLVLSNSIAETVNLCAMYTLKNWNSPAGSLYTDIPTPTSADAGFEVQPISMDSNQRAFAEKNLAKAIKAGDAMAKAEIELQLLQADAYDKVSSMLSARQKEYRKWLTSNLTDAGLMIHKVSPEDRMRFIKTKRVVFGITKYGKEGLDDEMLDTVLLSTPFSSRNGLQQLFGRPTRLKPGKKSPLVVLYEDNIGQLIGMCRKLRGHCTAWPIDENGPFEFELHGHPRSIKKQYPPIFEDIKSDARYTQTDY